MDLPATVLNEDGTTTVNITKLRQLILETHQAQYMTAAAAGIHPYVLSLYVQGRKDIKVTHLTNLCKVLNRPPEDILGWVSFTVDADGNVIP